jgi:3-oxoacyl-[acyl-carrier-protein] synthase II
MLSVFGRLRRSFGDALRTGTSRLCGEPSRKVPVLTGIGVVSAIGNSKQEYWKNLLIGTSGIDYIRGFDTAGFPCRIGAEVKDLRPRDHMTRVQLAYYTLATKYAYIAYRLAKDDSGIRFFNGDRTDVIMGSALTSFDYVERELGKNSLHTFGGYDPTGISKLSLSSASAAIAAAEKVRGRVATVSTACVSGLAALGLAMERIRTGTADAVITGAADTGVTRFLLNLFSSAKFVSFEQDDPTRAVKPFDLDRTRSVLGDGACVLILEEESSARARGARIYARLTGFSQEVENVDELCKTDESGKRWAATIRRSLEDAGVHDGAVDYVNAHGPGDTLLDRIEASALATVLGKNVQNTWIGSIKGSVGSPLGAAGVLQVAASALALHEQIIPPSFGYARPDPECPLRIVSHKTVPTRMNRALVNGHAVGGFNASVVLEKVA